MIGPKTSAASRVTPRARHRPEAVPTRRGSGHAARARRPGRPGSRRRRSDGGRPPCGIEPVVVHQLADLGSRHAEHLPCLGRGDLTEIVGEHQPTAADLGINELCQPLCGFTRDGEPDLVTALGQGPVQLASVSGQGLRHHPRRSSAQSAPAVATVRGRDQRFVRHRRQLPRHPANDATAVWWHGQGHTYPSLLVNGTGRARAGRRPGGHVPGQQKTPLRKVGSDLLFQMVAGATPRRAVGRWKIRVCPGQRRCTPSVHTPMHRQGCRGRRSSDKPKVRAHPIKCDASHESRTRVLESNESGRACTRSRHWEEEVAGEDPLCPGSSTGHEPGRRFDGCGTAEVEVVVSRAWCRIRG